MQDFSNISCTERLIRRLLRKLDNVKKQDGDTQLQQTVIRHIIRCLVADITAALIKIADDRKDNTTDLSYEVRLRYPVYCHLKHLFESSPSRNKPGRLTA